jgi:DNA-binding GntR family transcriptional regulator
MEKNINKLGSLKKKPLNIRVYEKLLNSILDGTLTDGTKLSEVHIAKQLEVSATPVREALKKLSAEGFVEIKPYCGAIVKQIDFERIIDAYIVRESLEVLCAKLALPNLNNSSIDELKSLVNAEPGSLATFELVNRSNRFHQIIRRASKNIVLEETLENIEKIISRDRNISAANMDRTIEIYAEHNAIINAIEKNDISELENAIRTHIQNGLSYFKQKINN